MELEGSEIYKHKKCHLYGGQNFKVIPKSTSVKLWKKLDLVFKRVLKYVKNNLSAKKKNVQDSEADDKNL